MADEDIITPTRLATADEAKSRWFKVAPLIYVAVGVLCGLVPPRLIPERTVTLTSGERYAVIFQGPGTLDIYTGNKVTGQGADFAIQNLTPATPPAPVAPVTSQ